MGYQFRIGKAKPFVDIDSQDNRPFLSWQVLYEESDSAPNFPNNEEGYYIKGNGTWWGVSAVYWQEFCRVTGLWELFFNEDRSLKPKNKGTRCLVIQKCDLELVRDARIRYQETATLPAWFEGRLTLHPITKKEYRLG